MLLLPRHFHSFTLYIKLTEYPTTKQRESSATISAAPTAYEQTEPAKAQKILVFDCRGLEFTEFMPEGEWLAEGVESGTKFTGIDLTEGEWFDYDEKANDEVSIKELKWEINRA